MKERLEALLERLQEAAAFKRQKADEMSAATLYGSAAEWHGRAAGIVEAMDRVRHHFNDVLGANPRASLPVGQRRAAGVPRRKSNGRRR